MKRKSFHCIKRAVLIVLSILVLFWLVSPIPEITILFSLIAGYLGYKVVHLNAWQTVLLSVIGYFAGSLIVWKLAVREYVNSYPYIRMLIRPDNKWCHLFLMPPGTTRKIGENRYATTLNLRFPIKLEDYGKVRRIELHHYGQWSKRIRFRRGTAVWNGFMVSHPQTEIIETYQVPKSSTMMDHGEPVPIFILHSASQDYYLEHVHSTVGSNPGLSLATFEVESLRNEIKRLNEQLAEAERQKNEWHQRALAYEEIIEQQKAEIRGLLEAKGGLRDLAYEYMLTIYESCHSIEKALKALRGPRFAGWLNKYVVALIIGLAVIAYVWLNPEFGSAVYTFLSHPWNQVFVIILVGVIVAGIYYWKKR